MNTIPNSRFILAASAILLTACTVHAQLLTNSYKLSGQTATMLSSNTVSQILIDHGTVFFGTDKGLNVTTDGGRTFQDSLGTGGPSSISLNAIAVIGDTIIAAVSGSLDQSGTTYPVGKGLYASIDFGKTWTYEPQSIDSLADSTVAYGKNRLIALAITTGVNNVSYSATFFKGELYTANFAGGLRRSTDLGKTWHRVVLPPDYLDYITPDSTYSFQLSPVASTGLTTESNLNQRVFSIYSDGDSALYVGTADGIDKTTDGLTWYKFNHQNEAEAISGNFVVYITGQNYGTLHNIWAATVNATTPGEVEALSYTGDGGASWQFILPGHFFHSIAFNDSIVYAASDDGLFRTSDFGQTYQAVTNIYDASAGQSVLAGSFYAVAASGDSVWVGSGDGTAEEIDNGTSFDSNGWSVFRSYVSVGSSNFTYFYPNPFSPTLDVGRIHYSVRNAGSSVTIRIFDFSMHAIRTLIQNVPQNAGEHDVPWNGLGDAGGMVDNGVYFYSVTVSNQAPAWGKILVVR